MVDTTTVAAAAAAATNAVAGIAAPPVCPLSPAWALTLDGILMVAIFLIRISLLSFVVRLISRHTADISFGKSVFVALCMTGLFGFLYVAPEWKPFATALFASTVVGTLFCKILFWIGFERSLYACLIYSIISGALADLPHRYLDIQLPGRATITLALAEIVDNRVRRRTEDPTLPASPSLHAALGRWSTSTNENVLSQFILGPLRAEQRIRAKIAEINKVATENALIVNEISGAGTHVGTRAEEAARLRQNMGLQKKQGAGSSSGAGRFVPKGVRDTIDGIGSVAGDEAAIVDALSGDIHPDAIVHEEGDEQLAGRKIKLPESASPGTSAARDAASLLSTPGGQTAAPVEMASLPRLRRPDSAPERSDVPAPVPPANEPRVELLDVRKPQAGDPNPTPASDPSEPKVEIVEVRKPQAAPTPEPVQVGDPFEGVGPLEREAWMNSMTGLVVTSYVRHRGAEGMAMVNGEIVRKGEVVYVESNGRSFGWRLNDVAPFQTVWEPMLKRPAGHSTTGIVTRF